MEIYTTTITVSSSSAFQYIDVTDEVQKAVETSGVRQGLALLYEMHTTGALVIQEADKSVHRDTQEIFDELISTTRSYHHDFEGSVNASAHIRNQLLGCHVAIPIVEHHLTLGTWQRIFFIEMFRPQKRQIVVCVMGKLQ
jgi:secondary thiamine-phosphate synthase enzyme